MPDDALTVFNGRYELLRRLARGGMADVYLARDVSLGRQVAVKVLFPEFANDPSFVERFRREAKTAAHLNHPNIVGIYDWGQEQGTYYIVMEYVVGRSVADVLRSSGPLSADRAAEIACETAEALASAHEAGLVHRDVKLGNIIVSDDGKVKVADFGIATALARRTGDNLTQVGSVMGTATYFSPEQAQGKRLDGRSDLYSLGVVLYEMIVGRPPFSADTSTAVAVKHVQERPMAPSAHGVVIAPSLEAIILKLLAKSPANRYPKAEDLCSDLRRYLGGERTVPTRQPRPTQAEAVLDATGGANVLPPQPGAQASPPPRAAFQPPSPSSGPPTARPPHRGGVPPGVSPPRGVPPAGPSHRGGPTAQPPHRGGPTAQPPLGGVPSGASPPRGVPPGASPPRGVPPVAGPPHGGGPPVGPVPAGAVPPQYVPPTYFYEEVQRSDGWKRTALMLVGLAALISVLVFLALSFYRALGIGESDDGAETPAAEEPVVLIEVPDLIGLAASVAQGQLLEQSLMSTVEYEVNTEVTENTVFRQSPPAGQRVNEGASVTLTVSKGENPTVPAVRGRNRVDAQRILTEAGYVVISLEESSQAEVGIVVGQEPVSGTELALGEAVTITISTGPGQIFVPDVRDQSLVDAFKTLTDLGFRVGERREPSETVPEGSIIDTDPTIGSPIGADSAVFVIISTGLPLVSVPDVAGLLFDTGRLALEREGLVIGIVTFEPVEPGSPDIGRILAQTPPANVEVDAETAVDLVVGESGLDDPEPPDPTVPTTSTPPDTPEPPAETPDPPAESPDPPAETPDPPAETPDPPAETPTTTAPDASSPPADGEDDAG